MTAKKSKNKTTKKATKRKKRTASKKGGIYGGVLLLVMLIAVLVYAIVKVSNIDKTVKTADLSELSIEAEQYAIEHGLSTQYCFFVNYAIPSGTPRFFVWDFAQHKVVGTARCMHGSGLANTASTPVFSNRVNSNCSSLGRFEVLRNEHGSRLRRSFRLQGLDKENSNAYGRGLLIHSSRWVDQHKHKKYIPLHTPSCQGCVTISTNGMRYVEKLVKGENKNILLWTFYEQ